MLSIYPSPYYQIIYLSIDVNMLLYRESERGGGGLARRMVRDDTRAEVREHALLVGVRARVRVGVRVRVRVRLGCLRVRQ